MLLARLGRFDEARAEIGNARRLDPLSPAIVAAAANIDYYAGDYGRSAEAARAALKIDDAFLPARVQLAMSLAMSGDSPAALRELEPARGVPTAAAVEAIIRARGGALDPARLFLRAAEARPDAAANGYAIAAVRVALGDRDGALQWLRAAADAHSFWLAYVAVDPVFAPLRDDPRFRELLTRVGLAGHV
jgi:tetratricopeptide (TPR) repeat protein